MKSHYDEALRHSRQGIRRRKQEKARLAMLGACVVFVLILLTLSVFIFCMIADGISGKIPPAGENPGGISSADTLTVPVSNADVAKGDLILINYITDSDGNVIEKHYYDPAKAPNLTLIAGTSGHYSLLNEKWLLNADALTAFNKMMAKNREVSEGGESVSVTDAYRTEDDQIKINKERVGYSDHHSGYCLAIRVNGQELSRTHWISENGHQYGFIVRYPDEKTGLTGVSGYEFCIRYVGVAHATYMKNNNLCLEEYIELLQGKTAADPLQFKGADGCDYRVFYTPVSTAGDLTNLQIPKGYAYTISGDNEGGFIVTVNFSRPAA